jgi:DNA polymerase-3 subunit gamma/tau
MERLQALESSGGAVAPARSSERAAERPARYERAAAPSEPSREPEAEYASESAPEEAAPAAAASGPAGDIQTAWTRLLALIKTKGQRSTAAFLKEARPAALTDTEMTITFPAQFAFHRTRLAESKSLEFVEECISEVVGRKLKVRLTEEGGKAAAPNAGPAEAKPANPARASAAKTEGVQRAVEMFGGRVVEEEE